MSEQLDEWPSRLGGWGSNQYYPWETWLDGSVWQLWRGDDYACTHVSMQSQVRTAGVVRDLATRTMLVKDGEGREGIVIQATGTRQPK